MREIVIRRLRNQDKKCLELQSEQAALRIRIRKRSELQSGQNALRIQERKRRKLQSRQTNHVKSYNKKPIPRKKGIGSVNPSQRDTRRVTTAEQQRHRSVTSTVPQRNKYRTTAEQAPHHCRTASIPPQKEQKHRSTEAQKHRSYFVVNVFALLQPYPYSFPFTTR